MKPAGWGLLVLAALIWGGAAAGCTHPIDRHGRARARAVAPSESARDPAAHQGQVVIWGGVILETVIHAEGTELVILEAPLGTAGEPLSADQSAGRFLAWTTSHFDPEIYHRGRRLTLAGTLEVSQTRLLGDLEYAYPVVRIEQHYLWPVPQYLYFVPGGYGSASWGWYAPYYGYAVPWRGYYGDFGRPYRPDTHVHPRPLHRQPFSRPFREGEAIQRRRDD
jgi:starvation-inducible outer membrane lipoprotein